MLGLGYFHFSYAIQNDVTERPTSEIIILTSGDALLSGMRKYLGEHNIARRSRDCSSLKLMHR